MWHASSELVAARTAGWHRAELSWERLQEEGNAALLAGDSQQAIRLFRRARWLAIWRFGREDPRWATTLANLAFADRLAGREARAQKRYRKARRVWGEVGEFIAGMQSTSRARSSLFHLRLEGRHRQAYQANMRNRLTAFASETFDALVELERGATVDRRLYERWRAEKLPIFDDTRKLLSAALLVAIPPCQSSRAHDAGSSSRGYST
jgi:hypothetical protein